MHVVKQASLQPVFQGISKLLTENTEIYRHFDSDSKGEVIINFKEFHCIAGGHLMPLSFCKAPSDTLKGGRRFILSLFQPDKLGNAL